MTANTPPMSALMLCIAAAACPLLSCCAATVPHGLSANLTGEGLEAQSKIAGPNAKPWNTRIIGVRLVRLDAFSLLKSSVGIVGSLYI